MFSNKEEQDKKNVTLKNQDPFKDLEIPRFIGHRLELTKAELEGTNSVFHSEGQCGSQACVTRFNCPPKKG